MLYWVYSNWQLVYFHILAFHKEASFISFFCFVLVLSVFWSSCFASEENIQFCWALLSLVLRQDQFLVGFQSGYSVLVTSACHWVGIPLLSNDRMVFLGKKWCWCGTEQWGEQCWNCGASPLENSFPTNAESVQEENTQAAEIPIERESLWL